MSPERDDAVEDILDRLYEYVECFANRPLGLTDEYAARLMNGIMEDLKTYDSERFWKAWSDGSGKEAT